MTERTELGTPSIHSSVFVADTARIHGDVTIGAETSVGFGAVIRCELSHIHIGSGCSIQDNAVLHADNDEPTVLGNDVTVGHGAIIHAATVDDEALIGMGSIVLNRAHVGRRAMVAAGSVVPPGMHIDDGMLAIGSPAKVLREIRESEWESTARGIRNYRNFADLYRNSADL